jgi:transcriptional regulator with XRE-family HTH domain
MTGNDLKKLRQRLKITQTQLAELLGYATNVHIFRLEARGRRKLPAGATARVKAIALEKHLKKKKNGQQKSEF